MEDSLLLAKLVSMFVLGIISFILGILPIQLTKWLRFEFNAPRSQLILSLLLCFGGGVLLYTTFLHLTPEVSEALHKLQETGEFPKSDKHIHFPELIFCCGFFFVYLVEELVHCFLDSRHEEEDEAVLHRTMSIRKCGRHPVENGVESASNNATNLIPRVSLGAKTDSGSNSTQGLISSSTLTLSKSSPLDAELRMTGGPLVATVAPHSNENHKHAAKFCHSHSLPVHHSDGSDHSEESVAKSFRGLLAVLALSFHAVFEGLAVGLETSVSNVWYLFTAIATHKFVIAFCVGIELMNSGTRKCLLILCVATFAIVSPLGIAIGIIVGEFGGNGSESVATVVLQGMAAGTLVYVVFFEVLQRERANTQSGFFQLIAIMAGFAVMLCLQLITGHDHDHDHEAADHSSINMKNITDALLNGLSSTIEHGHDHHHDHEHEHDHHH